MELLSLTGDICTDNDKDSGQIAPAEYEKIVLYSEKVTRPVLHFCASFMLPPKFEPPRDDPRTLSFFARTNVERRGDP